MAATPLARVAVIGAGLSGLTTAKSLRARGVDVVVLEKARSLGGVWDPDRSYPNIRTQTNRPHYSFSDYPMPTDWPEWPEGHRVHTYLGDYAKQFGIADAIRYEREVVALRRAPDADAWIVRTDGPTGAEEERFSHVAVCSGTFNRPKIPEAPGMDAFRAAGGTILHTSQATEPDIVTGKRVIVVGFQKSAADIAAYSAARAASTTLVYRRPMWKIPTHFLGVVNIRHVMFSRAAEAMFEPWEPTAAERAFHRYGRPGIRLFWRAIEAILRTQFQLKKCGLLPEHTMDSQVSCALSIAPPGYYPAIRNGTLVPKRGSIASFRPGCATLEDGSELPADVVIYGTGYTPSLPFLAPEDRAHVVGADGHFRLYRYTVSPALENLGFVGYNSSLFCQLSAELAARWLVEVWSGTVALPPPDRMRAAVEDRLQWYREHRPMDLAMFHNACTAPFNYRHWDELRRDLGERTTWTDNRLREAFRPLTLPHFAPGAAAGRSRKGVTP